MGQYAYAYSTTIIILYDAVIYKFPCEHELDILVILQVLNITKYTIKLKCVSFFREKGRSIMILLSSAYKNNINIHFSLFE